MKKLIISLAFCLPLWAMAQIGPVSLKTKEAHQTNALVYLPDGYQTDKTHYWPVIVFLHGSGERGTDIEKVRIHGPFKQVDKGEKFPCIIIAPQCPEGQWWDRGELHAFMQKIKTQYRIDPKRVYLTGLSMGGYATWDYACFYPNELAAVVPICGGVAPHLAAWMLVNKPLWVFHGAKDNVVPISESQNAVEALKAQGSKVKFTVYPEAGHDSWTETFANPELYRWLMDQHLD